MNWLERFGVDPARIHVVENWLDEVLVGPWVSLASTPTALATLIQFNRFPGKNSERIKSLKGGPVQWAFGVFFQERLQDLFRFLVVFQPNMGVRHPDVGCVHQPRLSAGSVIHDRREGFRGFGRGPDAGHACVVQGHGGCQDDEESPPESTRGQN